MLSARTRGGRELGALKEVLKRCGQAASRFGLHVWIRLPGPAEQRDHASAPASVRAGGVPYGGRRTGARESPWLSRQAIACARRTLRRAARTGRSRPCLLYTSDAADDL